ncbi:MAG: hypothetical protein KY462_06750 [Actinobacteria bacterium]|nr:hypothetical protein [Actinomycetota bacterium]
MADTPLAAGKVPVDLLASLLDGFGPTPPEVRVGPGIGEDAAAIDVPAGILVVATDPVTLTGSDVGAFAVVVNANDVAVMGARPRWFLASVLLPQGTTESELRELFADLRMALDDVGAALVGGHTEVTAAVTQPVVVGQMIGLVDDRRVVATCGARPGDVLVQSGAVPVEGAAVLAAEAADRLGEVDPATLDAARNAIRDPGISVVDGAILAAQLGATALHDPTEGGLASGLHELARASGVGLRVDADAIAWFEPGLSVCRALGADPWATLASGCLLATFPPDMAREAVDALRRHGVTAATVGEVIEGEAVTKASGEPVAWPERDEVARLT